MYRRVDCRKSIDASEEYRLYLQGQSISQATYSSEMWVEYKRITRIIVPKDRAFHNHLLFLSVRQLRIYSVSGNLQ